MTNEEEMLDKLTTAHRALAARTEALFQLSKVMFAIIPADKSTKTRLLTAVYDETNHHMEQAGFDREFQEDVRRSIDELANVILAPDR